MSFLAVQMVRLPVTVQGSLGNAAGAGDFGICPPSPAPRRAAADWKHKEARGADQQALLPLEQRRFRFWRDEVYCGGRRGRSLSGSWRPTGFQRAARSAVKAGSGAAGAAPRFYQSINSGRRSYGHCPGWYGGLCSGSCSQRTAGHLLAGASAPRSRIRAPTLSGLTGYVGS